MLKQVVFSLPVIFTRKQDGYMLADLRDSCINAKCMNVYIAVERRFHEDTGGYLQLRLEECITHKVVKPMSLYSEIITENSLKVKDGNGKVVCEHLQCPRIGLIDEFCNSCTVRIRYRDTLDPDGRVELQLKSYPTNFLKSCVNCHHIKSCNDQDYENCEKWMPLV
jgi:hypothetical protein